MVKTEFNNQVEGVLVSMEGNIFKVMAEEMLCIEKFHDCVKERDENMAESFRAMVLYWAKGGFDD